MNKKENRKMTAFRFNENDLKTWKRSAKAIGKTLTRYIEDKVNAKKKDNDEPHLFI